MDWEIKVLDYIEEHMQGELRTEMMKIATFLGDKGIFIGSCVLLMGQHKELKKPAVAMVIALALEAVLCNLVVKPAVKRTRPYDKVEKKKLLIPRLKDHSFPSGHTGAIFSSVGALFFSKTKLWMPAAMLASSTGFSRMYFYVHYPTDVLMGMGLGLFSGGAAVWLQKKFAKHKNK